MYNFEKFGTIIFFYFRTLHSRMYRCDDRLFPGRAIFSIILSHKRKVQHQGIFFIDCTGIMNYSKLFLKNCLLIFKHILKSYNVFVTLNLIL